MSSRHRRLAMSTGVWRWQNRDLWPDYIRGWLICSWRGHSFTVPKMYGRLCSRCCYFKGLS